MTWGLDRVQAILEDMGVSRQYPHGLPHRAIFCNRTLNMRAIQAIGELTCHRES